MNSISCSQLKQKLINKEDILLIDVREDAERVAFNIGGIHIPLSKILKEAHQIPTNKPVIFYCSKGIRSVIAIQKIQNSISNNLLFNLQGGLNAWKK